MRREDLQKIALDEARKALGVTDRPDLKFERRGGLEEWDEGIYRNVFEVNFRVWKPVALVDTELDAKTGEVLSWRDKVKIQESGEGFLTRQEAIQIAMTGVELPDRAGNPEIKAIIEDGKSMTLVIWTFRTSPLETKSTTLEVMIHPGTREICGVRRLYDER